MEILTGIPASKGVAIGPGFIYSVDDTVPERKTVSDPQNEIQRFSIAKGTADKALEDLYNQSVEHMGKDAAEIFSAHRMMLEDPELNEEIENIIINEKVTAEFAVYQASEATANMFESLDDAYFSARAADIRDVGSRVIRILQGDTTEKTHLDKPAIILAHDLLPSDTVRFDRSLILGFCTALGGSTSHAAIISKAMGIPAVVGTKEIPQKLDSNTTLILDGTEGKLIINPDENTLSAYYQKQIQLQDQNQIELALAHQPAVTKDGITVEVVANIGNLIDAEDALDKGAEGVGLLRTEFSFMEHNAIPDEDSLFKTYQEIFKVFGNQPIIVRTLDIGGDKDVPHLALSVENNPFLGNRGIRLCFDRPDLFHPQLRAILRAGVHSNLHIMFPMVSAINEVRRAKNILQECIASLKEDKLEFNENPKVGIMVEVPSAAVCADLFAKEVDFFSIGTNDLTQYSLAVDRTNANVAHLGSELHPAVLRLIHQVIQDGHNAGIWVGMCGEMAANPIAIPILLGFGLDEFSVTPSLVPATKANIRKWDLQTAKTVAKEALNCESAEEVTKLVEKHL
jgi:phosphotransferase system enzyme I (PtsI)